MPLIAPVLDDRSFEQLRSELVNRIPVFNPDWTDHNRSDPAITLLELFAWMGEGLQFRFNQIPEATQLAFLRLLDLPLQPARPATGLLTFHTSVSGGVAVYAGDQVKAGKTLYTVEDEAQIWPLDCLTAARLPDSMPDESSEPELFAAVQGTLDAVAQARNGQLDAVTPYRTAWLEADGSSPPLDCSTAVDGCVWIAVLKDPLLQLQTAPGRAIRLNLGFVPEAIYPTLDDIEACPGEPGGGGPSLEWRISATSLAADGSPRYLPLRILADNTAGFTREGVVRLELPHATAELGVPAAPAELAGTGDFPPVLDDKRAGQLWFWLRVWRSDQSRIDPVRLICLNAASCVQAVQAPPELVGSGSGQPGQVFQLANFPLLSDARHPVQLQVEENGVWNYDWRQRDDLDASGADDRHFRIDAEAGTLIFGERFPQIGERVRVSSYRFGGGSAGNVPARAISRFGDLLAGPPPAAPMKRPSQADIRVSNPLPLGNGVDSESLEQALQRIPGELRRRSRAVCRDDFSELALMTPGVHLGRAECLPLFHAPSRVTPRPGVVSVVIWPARDPLHPDAPLPDSLQLQRVCQWLDAHRLVTTELYVIPPVYRRLAISVSVRIREGFGLDAVRDWVELLLRRYLAPLPPYGPDGNGWPLGRRVVDRELEGVAMQVEGVEYVEGLRLAVFDDGQWQESEVVTLQRWQVVEVAAVTVVDDNTPLPAPGDAVAPPPASSAIPVPILREVC